MLLSFPSLNSNSINSEFSLLKLRREWEQAFFPNTDMLLSNIYQQEIFIQILERGELHFHSPYHVRAGPQLLILR